MSLDWRGDIVLGHVLRAAERGVNKTMAKCVMQAKQNHPGWQNRTVTAEGSVRIINYAETKTARTFGTWGSLGVEYVYGLEIYHGSFLRRAADVVYPSLTSAIKESLHAL